MLLKILGSIDLASALAFLMLVFGVNVFTQYLLFCAGLLLLKGMFVFTGDVLSAVDLAGAILLILSIFFSIPVVLLWIFAFLFMGKGVASFI